MFEAIRRAQLQRAGLSCGRTRRKNQEDDLLDLFRCHPAARIGVIAVFLIGVGILLRLGSQVTEGLTVPGALNWMCASAVALAAIIHLFISHKQLIDDNRMVLLILGAVLLHLSLMLMALKFGIEQGWNGGTLVLFLPHAFAPLVLSVMLGRRMGVYGAIHSTLLGAMVVMPVAPAVNPFTFLAGSALVGFLVILVSHGVRRRHRLFMAGLHVGASAAVFSFLLYQAAGGDGSVSFGLVAGAPFVSGVVSGMVVGGLLPVLEAVFGVTTDVTWLELADLNHPLMRRLSIEAPGTYHHSLVVANLAEAAAETIGASATMCRVCAYFHDIGKLSKPDYFIENMDPADNPHKDLTARMSALVLIAHVKDGVDLAIKHNLNARIIDVIEQHHGTSLVWYFYRQALDHKEEVLRLVEQDKAKEDDVPQVSEEVFRYPGPRPSFKESAIISLADAVESASRTMEKPSASRIETMVDDIVQARMADGQLDESDLTIADLARVKASFSKTLLGMMHNRIKYTKEVAAPATEPSKDKEITREFAIIQAMADAEVAPVPTSAAGRRRSGGKKPPPPSAPSSPASAA
ncbi:MAG: HDIG domain-containing protein [Verrucomicrobiaceae bacterium]|nr:HDIG domain-containing protein [Verrucomicrobiaceae bacterium]